MAIPSSLDPLNFNATFDPAPDEGYQFTFSDAGGALLNNAFFVPAEGGPVEITLVGATFAEPSLIWSIPLDGPTPTPAPIPTDDGTKVTFSVPAVELFFRPSVFRINAIPAGSDDHAVRSQNIYLVKSFAFDRFNFFLTYSPATGNFALQDSPASPQDGLDLDNTLALINTVVPPSGSAPFLFTVTLNPPPTTTLAPSFNSPPVVWGIDPSPGWILAFTLSPQVALFVLYPAAVGQSVSLQFSLNVPISADESITVLSPDPIIMNATIGDG